jgi:uncharacterized FlgJ-related protein
VLRNEIAKHCQVPPSSLSNIILEEESRWGAHSEKRKKHENFAKWRTRNLISAVVPTDEVWKYSNK